jgi:hypothetical protein
VGLVPPGYRDSAEPSLPSFEPVGFQGPTNRLVISPYDYQAELIQPELPARFNFLAWGTKAGKTTSAIMRAVRLLWETSEKRYRWIAPFHQQTEIAKGRILKILPRGFYQWKPKLATIIGPQGSQLSFHSGERPDTLPGDDIDGAVLDEASRLREEVFNTTVSTVLATNGWILAISTPHGRNWFYHQCKKAYQGEAGYYYRRFTSIANPTMSRAALDQTMRSVPKFVFDELVLAKFVSDVASTFPSLVPCSTPTLPRNAPEKGRKYLIAMDVGQVRDRNVITIWDVLDGALVSWAIAQGRDYTLITDDTTYLSKLWNRARVFVERNNAGLPIIQSLQRRGVPLGKGPDGKIGFNTTGATKPMLVHMWSFALRNKEPLLPSREKFPDLFIEHENFEYTIAKTGHWSFAAAPGFHDDIVMSSMIGWWAVMNSYSEASVLIPGTSRRRIDRRDKILIEPS